MIDARSPDYTNHPASAGRATFRYWPHVAFDEPAVSILTPFFNPRPEEFEQTARCVLGQSLQRFEWVIVNDASTDPASLEALARWRDADRRIRVIDLDQNAGPSAARNRGFAEARSDLVFQLDADDLIEATMLEKCVWHARTHPDTPFINTWEVGFGTQEYLWRRGFNESARFFDQCLVGAHMVLVRKEAHALVGGYDESIRGGMEDWEFWLRCADHGLWGHTLPEFLGWYRRRDNHVERWENWDGGERQRLFRDALRRRYERLRREGMPGSPVRRVTALAALPERTPIENPLPKESRRVLMVLPWMRMGGSDKFNLDLVGQLRERGWEVTIATTLPNPDTWQHAFARHTPDIFPLHTFCNPADAPLALRYLIESRRPDVVLISNSDAGYLFLPYLRAVCPRPAYVDYNHMEEMYWREGGYPRTGAAMADLLDLSITSSEHLRGWMIEHGSAADRIEVATTNVNPKAWTPDATRRSSVRERLGIPDDTAIILYAGRICCQKQPGVLARSLRDLANLCAFGGQDFRCIVAGDGELRPSLEREIAEFGLQHHVRMLGEVSNEEINDLMAASDILFLPSRWEGIALVLYEAMSAGVVVVGADVGGQKELLTPECGFLLPRAPEGRELDDEPGPYARALHTLIADPARRARMAAASRERVSSLFTLSQMGERMDALLRRAIERHAVEARAEIPASLARESAVRAVDLIRLGQQAERLWRENQRQRDELRSALSARARDPVRPAANEGATPPDAGRRRKEGNSGSRARRKAASARRARIARRRARASTLRELGDIEGSRAWRAVMRLKRGRAYAVLARLRWGPNWRRGVEEVSPERRLASIKGSRAFRTIHRVKRMRVYRMLVARRRGEPAVVEVKPTLADRARASSNGSVNGSASQGRSGSLQDGEARRPRPAVKVNGVHHGSSNGAHAQGDHALPKAESRR